MYFKFFACKLRGNYKKKGLFWADKAVCGP